MPTDEELHGQVRTAVQAVLWNASNYPANVQARMLGQDVSPLTAKVTDAILPLIAETVAAERERCAKAILDQAEVDAPSNSALYHVLIDRIYSDN